MHYFLKSTSSHILKFKTEQAIHIMYFTVLPPKDFLCVEGKRDSESKFLVLRKEIPYSDHYYYYP